MKKRWLCALLALWMLAGLLPFAAFAEGEDLTPYVPVLQDAMKNSVSPDVFGEAMFFDLDDKAPREMILVRCPEDAVHAVVEVYTIHGSEAERLMQTPLFVMVGGNTGAVGVGEFENRPILVCESTAPEAGENTVTIHGGVKRFTMDHGRVEIDESAAYHQVIDISDNAPVDPVIYSKSDATIQGEYHSYEDFLDWRHSFVILAYNDGFVGEDWDDDAEPFSAALDYCTTGFWDVRAGSYYAEAVAWAAETGVTTGTSADWFSPREECTRAQFVTFLWRAKDKPKAKTDSAFSDVKSTSYYYDAVSWAVGEKITEGVGDNRFDPGGKLTRAQVVTFLWRMAGSPSAAGETSFTDVRAGSWYADAVAWAVKTGVTNGVSETSFAPGDPCTRAQAVTFLFRMLG